MAMKRSSSKNEPAFQESHKAGSFAHESHEMTRTAEELPTEHTDYTEELETEKGGSANSKGVWPCFDSLFGATFKIQY